MFVAEWLTLLTACLTLKYFFISFFNLKINHCSCCCLLNATLSNPILGVLEEGNLVFSEILL